MKITIIGAGNMGGAIARGLASGTIVDAKDITVTAHTQKTLDKLAADIPSINTTLNNLEAAKGADVIMLAIKPWLIKGIIDEIKPVLDLSKQIIVSIVAGVSFDDMKGMFGDNNVAMFRVIPNTAISIKQSPTIISCCNTSDSQVEYVTSLFNELGEAFILEERLMAAATAVTSCGIAYAFEYIKAAIQASIELGLYPRVAKSMINQTVAGAAALLEANGTWPEEEIYKVCTPGGITIKGLNEMTAQGFDHAVISGLKKAAGKI